MPIAFGNWRVGGNYQDHWGAGSHYNTKKEKAGGNSKCRLSFQEPGYEGKGRKGGGKKVCRIKVDLGDFSP